jgi:leucyl aminopeptidase
MDVKVIPGAIQESDADAIVVGLFEDAQPTGAIQAVDQALRGAVRDLIDGGDFNGKADQVAVLYPRGAIPARRVILVGLGPRDDFDLDALRRAVARALQKARDLKARRVAVTLQGDAAGGIGAAVEPEPRLTRMRIPPELWAAYADPSYSDVHWDLKNWLKNELMARLDPSVDPSDTSRHAEIRAHLEELFDAVLSEEGVILSRSERKRLFEPVVAEILGRAPVVEALAQAITEGSLLGLYDYRGQKSGETPEALPQTLELMLEHERDLPAARRGVQAGGAIAAGVTLTRDLVNLPPNVCTPAYMAEVASQVAGAVGLRVQVLDEEEMAALNMGALLAVAQGSDTPPRLIILEHNAGRAEELDTLVLVGKGVTFDTGGYSLKAKEGMATMKGDMAGAAAVIGAMRAIGALDVPLHVVGLAPAADNMISGHAYRPQEVVTASNGVTIEIVSTDAEGRMLLADALVYAGRFQPAAVVDIATLTGACAIALGKVAAGLFSTDGALREALLAAAAATAEKLWSLPLFPEYEKAIESQTADVKNSGGRQGGVGASATFLKHFVSYPAWAHVDMAGMEFEAKDNPYAPGKGATGFGVRLLTEFVRRWDR